MKQNKIITPFEIESFEIPALEAKIKQLHEGYMSSRGGSDYWNCLKDVLSLRKEIINESFEFTPYAVLQIERVNNLLTERTAKMLSKTKWINAQMQAEKQAGDDFLDDYHIEATLEVCFRGEESIFYLETDENAGNSDYAAIAEILSFTPDEKCKPLRSFHLHDPDSVHCPFTDEELLRDEMFVEKWNDDPSWDKALLDIPALSHIPYFCYAFRVLYVFSNYSLSDIIRINHVRCDVSVDWRSFGAKKTVSSELQQKIDEMTSYKNVPLTELDLEKVKTKFAGLRRLMRQDIESTSIFSLEEKIKSLYQKYLLAHPGIEGTLLHDIRELLSQRRELINKNFKFTPLAMKHIERVNELLNTATIKVYHQAIETNRLLNDAKLRGDDFAQDYNWEAYVQVGWKEKNNLLEFEDDENKGVSDYIAMAEILNETRRYNNLRGFHFFESLDNENSTHESKDGIEDDLVGKLNWNIEIFSASELAHIPYICYASHDLFHHHYYSLSDIIRITDISCEIELQMTHKLK